MRKIASMNLEKIFLSIIILKLQIAKIYIFFSKLNEIFAQHDVEESCDRVGGVK